MSHFTPYTPLSTHYPTLFRSNSIADIPMSHVTSGSRLPDMQDALDAYDLFMGQSGKNNPRTMLQSMQAVFHNFLVRRNNSSLTGADFILSGTVNHAGTDS